jgi:hypothetical protein
MYRLPIRTSLMGVYEMSKVVVVLEGGLVQAVYSDEPGIEVAILDHDIFEDIEPKLDLDNFFQAEVDSTLAVLREWQEKKASYQANESQNNNA